VDAVAGAPSIGPQGPEVAADRRDW